MIFSQEHLIRHNKRISYYQKIPFGKKQYMLECKHIYSEYRVHCLIYGLDDIGIDYRWNFSEGHIFIFLKKLEDKVLMDLTLHEIIREIK